ncbi:MAG: CRISPR-associated protein Cas4 [Bacteroidia bacterium]
MTITPSHILEYLFCPRFTYFEYVLGIPQSQEKYYKVMKGREVHSRKEKENRGYLRKRLGVVAKQENQYLSNGWLRGEVDEVLELSDGSMAPLDYKFAKFEDRVYETYKTQLYCYAVLIEHNYGRRVEKGYLVYTRSGNHVEEIEIGEAEKAAVGAYGEEIVAIIDKNYFPKATRYKKKCVTCTYKNLCIQ